MTGRLVAPTHQQEEDKHLVLSAADANVAEIPTLLPSQQTEAVPAPPPQRPPVPAPRTPMPPTIYGRPPVAPSPLQKPFRQGRAVPIILIISCLLFLIATSLLAFIYFSGKSKTASTTTGSLTAIPDSLRVDDTLTLAGKGFGPGELITFTRDGNTPMVDANKQPFVTHTDGNGSFSLPLVISADWSMGQHVIYAIDEAQQLSVSALILVQPTPSTPPLLHLPSASIDLGTGGLGTTSKKTITLTNVGGGQIDWQAKSDSAWLTTSPSSGTFAGSAAVLVVVDRSTLSPQSYTGHILFSQLGNSAQPLVLTVTIVVTPTSTATAPPPLSPTSVPANLIVPSGTLSYVGDTAQQPTSQTLTLQNSGGLPLDWTASVTTKDGGNWLSATPSSGHLEPNTTSNVTVSVTIAALAPNSYQGTLTFTSAALNAPTAVSISLVVNPPPIPAIGLQSNELNFVAVQGTNPAPQTFTVKDTGTAPLHWILSEDSNAANLLFVSPLQGTVAPGSSATITVAPNFIQANAGNFVATITVSDSDSGTTVQPQHVTAHIMITAQAVITVSVNGMTFNNNSINTSTTQFVIITNTGSAPLHWTASSSASWLTADTTSGTLAPGATASALLTCDSSKLAVGTFTATFKVSDTDAGTMVTPQIINVTLQVGP